MNGSVAPQDALEVSRRELAQQGANPRWCLPWGFVLWQAGQYSEAHEVLAPFHSALQDDVDYLLLYGMVCRQLPENHVDAESSLRAAISLDPTRSDTHYNLGNLFFAQDRFSEAVSCYISSVELSSNWNLSWLNLGIAARGDDRFILSQHALRQCLLLDPSNIRAWCNYGITLHQLEQFHSATNAYLMALSLDQQHGPTLVNLAVNLNASNRHQEAVQYFEAASSLSLQEDCGDALFNLALTRLMLGEFEEGWRLYECRFKTRQFDAYSNIPAGEWIHSPERFRGLSSLRSELVVWSEQGLGDAIQFVRYIPLLVEMGFRPVVATRTLLVRLFVEWFLHDVQVIDDRKVDLTTDQRPHVSMMSLPYLLGTTYVTVPSHTPYLHPPGPPPEALHFDPPYGALSIGIVWASNPDNKLMYKRKSMPLSLLFEPLLPAIREDLIQFHSLQVGDDSAQLKPYADLINVIDWNGRIGDFSDTAHVVHQLDLVITVDTGVAHLASALGVPTWLMLHYDADFRWMRNCADSPWYPGMKLFRQHKYGSWLSVVKDMLHQLSLIYGIEMEDLD